MDQRTDHQRLQTLQDIVRKQMPYTAHDLDHVLRVYRLALLLAEKEKNSNQKADRKNKDGPDLEILLPAVLLHDIGRRLEEEDKSGNIDHAVAGAEMAGPALAGLGYSQDNIKRIQDCIKTHRFRSSCPPQTIEAKILFDADKLDVLGAVGIARSFMMAGRHGERIYRDVSPEQYEKENTAANGRIINKSSHASNLEFELKLKKIPERLYTSGAKEIARDRLCFMEMFFQNLKDEIEGKK